MSFLPVRLRQLGQQDIYLWHSTKGDRVRHCRGSAIQTHANGIVGYVNGSPVGCLECDETACEPRKEEKEKHKKTWKQLSVQYRSNWKVRPKSQKRSPLLKANRKKKHARLRHCVHLPSLVAARISREFCLEHRKSWLRFHGRVSLSAGQVQGPLRANRRRTCIQCSSRTTHINQQRCVYLSFVIRLRLCLRMSKVEQELHCSWVLGQVHAVGLTL